ncbi:MAG TPA: hypothetical protein VKZ97_04175 [Flavobacteriaceae bacterium]|nr:hypothetical protein [Flavobacteriaceae bacterium]
MLLIVTCLAITPATQAQFLKKLKKKAENAAERTILNKTDEVVSKKTGKTIDDATTKKDKNAQDSDEKTGDVEPSNTALNKNAEAKKAFYKEDVVINLHENGSHNQTQFFDADAVAVRTNVPDDPKPMYVDSEGFIYGFKNGEYQKSSIVALQSQGMMVPTMMLEAYKLPPEPFMAQLEKQHDLGMTANPFNGIVEFAFIYKPDDFRYEDFKETKQTQRGKTFTKFEFLNEPGYKGSYVLFDDKDRLTEIYTKTSENAEVISGFGTQPGQAGENLMVYEYKPVEVILPEAREVRAAGQGLMEMVMGGAVKGGNSGNGEVDDDDYDTSDSNGMTKSVKNSLKNHKVSASDLPESYDFDWVYHTEMLMGDKKKDKMDMVFLIKPGAAYQATRMVDEKSKDMGNTTMLFDSELNTMVMFMEAQGNKYLQMHPIPEVKNQDTKVDFKITELPSKKILNYSCKGLQMEDDRYIIKVYHTTQAKITLGNFLNFSGAKNMKLPDIDPRVLKQFSEGLIMEMHMEDKKKSKNNITITAKELTEKNVSIKKADFKTLDLFSGSNMMKN